MMSNFWAQEDKSKQRVTPIESTQVKNLSYDRLRNSFLITSE